MKTFTGGARALTVALALGAGGMQGARAQDAPAAAVAVAPASNLGVALSTTLSKGAPTVAVFTSAAQPASTRFWESLNASPWVRSRRGLVQFVNLSREADAGVAGISRFPSVVVYGRGPRGVAVVAAITDCTQPDALIARLTELRLAGDEPTAPVDLALARTSHEPDVYASGQVPQPPQPQPQPNYGTPTYQAPPPPAPQPTLTYQAPPQPALTSTNAGLVQVPGQSLMIQQQPTQVFMAPSQPPVVYVPQAQAAPQPTLAVAAPQPAANLYLSAAPAPAPAPAPMLMAAPAPAPAPTYALSAAPAPAPTYALAAAPAPAPTLALAAAPASLAGVTNQTLSLPNSRSRTRVRVRGPGPIASSLARFGEKLTHLGRARVETVQETDLESPYTQTGGGGLTTISTTSTTPIAPPPTQQTLLANPAPPQAPYCPPPAPPAAPPAPPTPQASPQRAAR